MFFRFSDTGSNAQSRPFGYDDPSSPQKNNFALHTYTLGENSAITDRFTNELRVNYSSNVASSQQTLDNFGGAVPTNLAQAADVATDVSSILSMGLGPSSSDYAQIFTGPTLSSQVQWNLIDTVSRIVGHHAFKFGVDFRRLTPTNGPYPYVYWGFPDETSVEVNLAPYVISGANLAIYPLFKNFSSFAQDEWRVSARLNLSLGLRWELNPPASAWKGIKPYTLIGADEPDTATLAPYGTPLWHTTWFNFAPRFGAAYVASNRSGVETVIRAGGGLFFDTGQQQGALDLAAGPGTGSSSAEFSLPYPQVPSIPRVVQPTPPYIGENLGNVIGYAPHLQLPYTLQWNASLQQAFGQMQSLTISYVGSHAARLLTDEYVVAPNNPAFGSYAYVQNGNTSDYNSLQAQFQRRLSAGLTALASYTWSHCLDYGSSNLVFGYQRGNCDFDVRQNFSSAFSYSAPSFGQDKVEKAVLNHWGLDTRFTTRAAFPVTLSGNQLVYPDDHLYDAGLNLVPGQPVYLYGANCASTLLALGDLSQGQNCPGGRAINPNAFVDVEAGLGNAPRNFARGFDAVQLDTAVRREFSIHEGWKLQFRAEAFNVLNHPNFGNVQGGFGSSNFGQAIATLASSLGVLSPLYQMGGPRSMQFALRVDF
jgi:hypothetical protein